MDLSVIIVNWNARDDLGRCLATLRPEASDLALETVVVDNASSDGSAALVRRRYPETRVIRLRRNLGFAAANNLGLAETSGRYRLLLNPDCLVHRGALAGLIAFADSRPRAGLVGPRLLYGDGTLQASCRRFPTPGALLFRGTPLERLLPRNPWSRAYLMQDWDHRRPRPVDWLSGACLLVREAALSQIGPLDERFFMYCEDMDWCRRAHAAGWEVLYLPTAVVTHLVGRSSDHRPRAMIREHHRSMARYLSKHYGPLVAALAAPLLAVRLRISLGRARPGS